MIPLCDRCHHGSDHHTAHFGYKRPCSRCDCPDFRETPAFKNLKAATSIPDVRDLESTPPQKDEPDHYILVWLADKTWAICGRLEYSDGYIQVAVFRDEFEAKLAVRLLNRDVRENQETDD